MPKAVTKNPNLDALIPREDFEIDEGVADHSSLRDTLDISALERGNFLYESLRKPDFQRETANWSPDKVQEFVRTFLDGDLVPAVILWKSKSNTFVIDGAHRLSALIAWVQDDYGDGQRSLPFFDYRIAPEQKKVAEETRALIKSTLGSYADYQTAAKNPDPSKPEMVLRAKRLGSNSIKVQWVTGDSKKAEYSFFKINQSATLIDDTELAIIKARRKPNALAARALIRAGTGHKYWSDFPQSMREQVEALAREIYDILFDPELKTPIKTLDLPVAGQGYSVETVKLILEFVNFSNKIRPSMWIEPDVPTKRKPKEADRLADDVDGTETVNFLRVVKRIASRIAGNNPSSLGLHPVVYFYGENGRYQSSTFLAVVALIMELESTNGFVAFTDARSRFEEFLLTHKDYVNQIVRKSGSGTKSQEPVLRMYRIILDGIGSGVDDKEIEQSLQTDARLWYLKDKKIRESESKRRFSTDIKNTAFLRDAIESAVRCKICNARIHVKSVSVDHITRYEDGGHGGATNAQIAHPYCNTGYKESQHARELRASE
jgi:hypothetical protein